MRLDDKSKAILVDINSKFVLLTGKNKGAAVHVESGDEMTKEGFKLYCDKHFGELTGFESKIKDGKEEQVEAKCPSGTAWWDWQDDRKRVVRRIAFEPGISTPKDVYNRWDDLKGTMCEPDLSATPEDIRPFLEHMFFISDDDAEGVQFFMNWLASLYRFPHLKLPTAVMLYSRYSRMGKSMLYELLSRVFGEPMVGMAPGAMMHSKWQLDIIEGKRLMVWNELSRTDKLDQYEQTKSFVSERRMLAEGKGTKARDINNACHSIITTNNANCLPLMEGDGRILVMRCEAKRKPDEYYKAFFEWCTGEGPALLAGVLARWEFPDSWDPMAPVPQTKATVLTQYESRSPLVEFVAELIAEHKAPFDVDFGQVKYIIENLEARYPSNCRSLKPTSRTLPEALKLAGAEQVFVNYEKDDKRIAARVWVWRGDWNHGAIKQALENEN